MAAAGERVGTRHGLGLRFRGKNSLKLYTNNRQRAQARCTATVQSEPAVAGAPFLGASQHSGDAVEVMWCDGLAVNALPSFLSLLSGEIENKLKVLQSMPQKQHAPVQP